VSAVDTRELPLCGHTHTWSLGPEHPLVCQLCHPRPGSTPPWPRRPAEPQYAFRESQLSPSPFRGNYR
jgi:hypothetical protein